MVRRRVKVGHDRHGQYIRYRGQKIYLSQAIIKKGTKSGMDNLDLIKWILKQLALRRRRRRRRVRKSKEYSNVVESKGSTGPKLPASMTHIPTMLYERQRLLDRAREQKMLTDSKESKGLPAPTEHLRLTAPEIRKMLTHVANTGEIEKDNSDNISFIDVNGAVTTIPKSHKLYSFAKGLFDRNEELERQARDAEAKAKDSEQKRKDSEQKRKKAEAGAITAKREQLQTELREKLEKQKTLQQEYKDVIDAADDTKSIEKIGDRDNLRAQLKDLGVKTGKGYPSKETVINALKARIEEINRHPEREEVTDKKKGTTKKLKEYIPIMKELRFYQAYVGFKKSLEDMEQDILTKKQELDSLTKESKQEESPKKATESTSSSKPKNATAPPKPKPKSESDKLPPAAVSRGEPLPSVTIEEVDDDDTHLEFPEKKKPNPEDEVVDSDEDVEQPSASAGDGSRNSKKSMKSSPPLDEHKINELMADIPGYLGTITKDEIPKLTKAAQKAWLAGIPFGWIHLTISRAQAVGNNKRPGEVGHWVAVAVVPDRSSVMYYDSFGRPAPADVKTMLKTLFDKVAPREFLKFKENLIQEQSVNTNNCGWFSIKFLLDIFGGLEFTETTPWNRSVQAERDIEAFKKKFKPFSWL